MKSAACVGGILEDGRSVRILKANATSLPTDTKVSVGDIYEIVFDARPNAIPPHVEDILVSKAKLVEQVGITVEVIENWGGRVCNGGTDILFQGNLSWTDSGSGFISRANGLPENSVGFWIPDKNLTRNDFHSKVKFRYPHQNWRSLPFVGFQDPIDTIPARTLVRVSLARWWSPKDENIEDRCYLQLSGWY